MAIEIKKPEAEEITVTTVIESFKDCSPCNWTLIALDDSDTVTASNTKSGETFVGTIQEFNIKLKG